MVARYRFSELLDGPLRARMPGHVDVKNLARAHVHHDEDVEERIELVGLGKGRNSPCGVKTPSVTRQWMWGCQFAPKEPKV